MAKDDRTIPVPKRGAIPTPREVLEDATPYKPDEQGKAKPSSKTPETPAPSDENLDEREREQDSKP